MTILKSTKILILGSGGLVGSAITRELKRKNYHNLLTPLRSELELMRQSEVEDYFKLHRPEFVIMAAAKVGGIMANSMMGADFIFENLQVQQNVFNAAFKVKTANLLFLGSSCIYPKNSPQPIKEEYLLTSPLEPTNEYYAIAKIAGVKTVEAFRHQYDLNWLSVMPTNLYGPGDTYNAEKSHVIPGLIYRLHEAIKEGEKKFEVWGSGKPRREFLYVDDLARACVFIMEIPGVKPNLINVGTGFDLEIGELATKIAYLMGYKGQIIFNQDKPDGISRKLLDISKIQSLGWTPQISLDEGLNFVIKDFMQRRAGE